MYNDELTPEDYGMTEPDPVAPATEGAGLNPPIDWWKLSQPERRTVTNPFTGGAIPNILTRDPGPRTRPAIPSSLQFSCLVLPSREDWEQNYLRWTSRSHQSLRSTSTWS